MLSVESFVFRRIDREDILAVVLVRAFFFHDCANCPLEEEGNVKRQCELAFVKQTIVCEAHESLRLKLR